MPLLGDTQLSEVWLLFLNYLCLKAKPTATLSTIFCHQTHKTCLWKGEEPTVDASADNIVNVHRYAVEQGFMSATVKTNDL